MKLLLLCALWWQWLDNTPWESTCSRSSIIYNSSTSFCLRSSSWRTDLSMHFHPCRSTTIWMFYLVTRTLFSLFIISQKPWNNARWLTLRSDTFQTIIPASHGIRTDISSTTCILHRPERYHLHHRGGCSSSSSRIDSWVYFQQNAAPTAVLQPSIMHRIDDCYQLTRISGGFSAQCLSKRLLKEFTALLLTNSFGSASQVVVILIG